MKNLYLLFLILSATWLASTQAQPSGCPQFSPYRGYEIRLYIDEKYAQVIAWLSPRDLNWTTFRTQCFDPDPFYWYSGLLKLVAETFKLFVYYYYNRIYINENSKQIFVVVEFYFSWSSYYSEDDGVLKFADVFKACNASNGYFNEVHVYSDKPVYRWEPTPTRYTSQEAHWLNPSYDAAPSWYIVYLWPVYKVTVRVEGLPSSYSVQVSIDGKPVGYVPGEGSRVFRVGSANVSVSVQPVVNVDERTRYRVDRDTLSVSAGGVAVFRYYREFLVRTDTSPSGLEILFGNASCRTPCSTWVREGDTLSVMVPERALENSTSNTRTYYAFTGWSDGSSERSRLIKVQKPMSLNASYTKVVEHYVSVTASPPEASRGVSGSGWYREGSAATLRANETIQVSDYERLRFVGWSTGETSSSIAINVSSPLSVEARYRWEYMVVVQSDLALTLGSGWYRKGDEARVGVEGLNGGYYYTSDGKVRYRFLGWDVVRGNIHPPASPTLSFTVEEPVALRAVFDAPEFQVCVDGACSFVRKGDWVTPRSDEPLLGGLLVKKFFGYLDPLGRNLGRSVLVDSPLELRSYYRTEVNWPLVALVSTLVVLPIALLLAKRGGSTGLPASLLALMSRFRRAGVAESGTSVRETQTMPETELAKTAEVEEELERIEEYLSKLEELRREGKVSEEAYRRLKEEYESKRAELLRLRGSEDAPR